MSPPPIIRTTPRLDRLIRRIFPSEWVVLSDESLRFTVFWAAPTVRTFSLCRPRFFLSRASTCTTYSVVFVTFNVSGTTVCLVTFKDTLKTLIYNYFLQMQMSLNNRFCSKYSVLSTRDDF